MSLPSLARLVLASPPYAGLAERARDTGPGSRRTLDLTGPPSLRPFVVSALVGAGRTVLAVTATTREAEELTAELGDLLGADEVAYYPSWETLPHERLSPRSDTVGKRLAVLRRLVHPGTGSGTGPLRVVVAPVRSVLQPQVKGLGELVPVEIATGDTVGLELLVQQLADAAYSRVDLVERRGEFAVRGGIIDVFPPTEEHPLRVELWGDDVEEIRSFSVADQRTLDKVDRLWAPPCRELLLTDEVRARAAELGRAHPQLLEITDKIAAGIATEGMESLAPVLVDDMELLVDLLPDDAHLLLLDPERVRARAHDLVATSEEFLAASWASAAGGGTAPIDLGAASYRSLGDVREHTLQARRSWWTLSPFGLDAPDADPRETASGDRAPRATGARARSCCRPWPRRPTTATSSAPSATSTGGAPRATTWSPSTRATGRRSAWSRPWASTTSRRGWRSRTTSSSRPSSPSPAARSRTGSSTTSPASPWSPGRTSRASAARPATCARCRRAARSRSTRWSSRRATSSSTSSTASAGSWR